MSRSLTVFYVNISMGCSLGTTVLNSQNFPSLGNFLFLLPLLLRPPPLTIPPSCFLIIPSTHLALWSWPSEMGARSEARGRIEAKWEKLAPSGQERTKQNQKSGLSRWSSGQESAYHCRSHRFNPWSRKIPHASEQLSPYATTAEPVLWSPQATTTEAHIF